MRRSALLLLLALGGTANAALSRVALEIPPVSLPAVSALSIVPSPLSAPVIPKFPGASPALPGISPAAEAASASPAAKPAAPQAIAASRANAPFADRLAAPAPDASGEDAARTLETKFDGAAALDSSAGDSTPALAPGDEAAKVQAPLLERLLQHVALEDDGVPERGAALKRAVERMLEAPTARSLAERFIADGLTAVVRFGPFEGSRIQEIDGRKIFHASYGAAGWRDGRVEVTMNQDYLGVDPEFRHQELPAYLAHELFGHGLWIPRASREDLMVAFQRHDLNETYARLVQWLVDFELDQRFEAGGALGYLRDPGGFLNGLKLRHSSYATTWSTAELARPRETLEERSKEAQAAREKVRLKLSNHSSWNAVIDHFASRHAVAEPRLRALRAYMSETAQLYQFEIGILDAVIAEVDATVGRMNAEPDRAAEKYLQAVAAHPFFTDLQRDTDESTRRLIEQVNAAPVQPGAESEAVLKAREEHWRGQITFDELVEMYKKDREEHPAHWQG